MSILIVLGIGFMLLVALGLGRSFNAGDLVNRIETAVMSPINTARQILTDWWYASAVPAMKKLVFGLVIICGLATLTSFVVAIKYSGHWWLFATVTGITVVASAWLLLMCRKTNEEFSALSALVAGIMTVGSMGVGVYLYGQMMNDIIVSLMGYVLIVCATEIVCSLMKGFAFLKARVVQMTEGSANIALQLVHELLFKNNPGLKKIIDVNIAEEEKFEEWAEYRNSKLRLYRDSLCLVGILVPSPITLTLMMILALGYSVCLRMFASEGMWQDANQYRWNGARTYVHVISVFLPLTVIRFAPMLLTSFYSEAAAKDSLFVKIVSDMCTNPTLYITIGAVILAIRLSKSLFSIPLFLGGVGYLVILLALSLHHNKTALDGSEDMKTMKTWIPEVSVPSVQIPSSAKPPTTATVAPSATAEKSVPKVSPPSQPTKSDPAPKPAKTVRQDEDSEEIHQAWQTLGGK